jgi:hypothetical protein
MYNIFAPFVLTLTFFNYGARWMGETFLPLYFYNTERIFIPPLQSSVSFSKVSPYAQMMTYPELDLDQELIYSALVFAQNVPDFKTCFPEVRSLITGMMVHVFYTLVTGVRLQVIHVYCCLDLE